MSKTIRFTLLALTLGAGCAHSTTPPPAVAQAEYRIGKEDVVSVDVWKDPALSAKEPVRPDGKISTPLVDIMVAVGKTPSQLARDLEKELAVYVKEPKVYVIVSQALSTFSQVKVIGQVAKPQAVPYRAGMRVLDVVLQVGGLSTFAAGNRAKIVRTVDGRYVPRPWIPMAGSIPSPSSGRRRAAGVLC